MHAKTIALAMLLAVLASLIGVIPAVAQEPDWPDPEPIDVGPRLRRTGPDQVDLDISDLPPLGRVTAGYDVGDTVFGLWYDDTIPGIYLATYTVVTTTDLVEVWLMDGLSFPAGDPRNPVVVTEDQVDYIAQEFTDNIYPKTIEFFGMPDVHDGLSSPLGTALGDPDMYAGTKTIIMVSNIGDEHYYDPDYPFYIAGFYWDLYEFYFNRNIINIDAGDWENRIGPGVAHPYLYEGTVAHEFQHLIHDDNDSDEELWVNEGMSMFANWLTGYATGEEQYDWFLDHAENSLVVWGDQEDSSTNVSEIVADYGIVYLWTLYLYEHFGGAPFVQALAQNETNGIESVDETLANFGYDATFADVFRDFRVACLIDSAKSFRLPFLPPGRWPGRGKDWVHPFEFRNADVHVNVDTVEAFVEPGAPPWGTDYITITGKGKLKWLTFDGADFVGTLAHSGDYHWYSTTGNAMWTKLSQQFEIPAGGATLNFWITYDIEEDWDYAYVMVRDLTAGITTTLAGLGTVDYLAWPQDIQPGPWADPEDFCQPHETTGECTTDLWHAFTGDGGGYVEETMDLSPFADHTIELSFVYWTDNYTALPGAYIDDVAIPEIGFFDDMETAGDWTNDGWEHTTGVVEADFSVTVVGIYGKLGKQHHIVRDMTLDDLTEEGSGFLSGLVRRGGYAVLLVTHEAGPGVQEYAPYEYEVGYPW